MNTAKGKDQESGQRTWILDPDTVMWRLRRHQKEAKNNWNL